MRLRFTVFLLVANLIVFGLIWRGANRRDLEQPPAELIFPANADRIALSGPDAPGAYELVLKNGAWQLATPFEWPAGPWLVQKLLDELRFVSREGSFTLAEAAKLGNTATAYGLENPRMTLTVSGPGSAPVSVKIGAMTPDGRAAYLLAPDNTTVIPAPNSLIVALARKPDEFRRPEILSLDPFEITGVTLSLIESGKETRIGLRRGRAAGASDDSRWRFETPVATDADTPEVDKKLADLAELRFRRFLPATPELLDKAGLAVPSLTLTLEGNRRRQILLVGERDPDEAVPHRFAKFKDSAAVFTIPADALKPWIEARRTMREHRFMRFDSAALTAVTIHEGGRSLVLQRLDDGKPGVKPEWHMPVLPGSTAAEALPVDNDVLAELANSLSNLTARDIPAPKGADAETAALCAAFVTDEPSPEKLAAWGFDNPVRKVDLTLRDLTPDGKETTRTLSLAIARPVAPETPVHAKLAGSPTVFSISPLIVRSLSVKPYDYRRRLLDSLAPADRIATLRITDLATGKVLVDEKKPDDIPDWNARLEGRPADERARLLTLLDLCRNPRAERFLGRPFAQDFTYDSGDGAAPESWRYRLDYTFKSADPAATATARTLFLTRRLGGSEQIAGSPTLNAVFLLPQTWIDALHPLTFVRDSSRDVPAIPAPAPAGAPPAK